jgi:hypothetical protein
VKEAMNLVSVQDLVVKVKSSRFLQWERNATPLFSNFDLYVTLKMNFEN